MEGKPPEREIPEIPRLTLRRSILKKRLIALRGKSNVGKSTALHNLNRLLLSEPSAKTLKFQKYGRLLDFSTVIDFNGQRVGIVNRGDIAYHLDDFLTELEEERCRIIVCAARTKGEIESVLASYARRYEVVEILKVECHDDYVDASNLEAAHQLAAYVYGSMIM